MRSFPRPQIRDLLLLSVAAGGADAAGYLGLGRVFTSNMTGNLVLLGIDLGQRQWSEAVHAAYVLAVFITGTFLGTWLIRSFDERDWKRILARATGCEMVLLWIFAALWWLRPESSYYLVTFLAAAMGFQAAALHRLKSPGVTTTAITGTLTSLVAGVIKLVFPGPGTSGPDTTNSGRLIFKTLVIGAYLGGAVISGVVMLHAPRFVGFMPAAVVLFVFLRAQ